MRKVTFVAVILLVALMGVSCRSAAKPAPDRGVAVAAPAPVLGLPVPTAAVEAVAPVAPVVAAPVAAPAQQFSPKVQRLVDTQALGIQGGDFVVKIEAGRKWYAVWSDVVSSVIGETCFGKGSDSAEKEGLFWAAVSQIPENTHPDKFSGQLHVPKTCDEVRSLGGKVAKAVDSKTVTAWGGWVGSLSKSLKQYPSFDPRRGGAWQ